MKLLLDEHLPHQLRHEIPGHEVYTVAYMGWAGVENGELLLRANHSGFDAIITNDAGVEHEQNCDTLPIAVVFLNAGANTLESLRPLVPELLTVLKALQPRTFAKLQH
ncbi:MAG TPA: DUF5615 family PIN-like protein [Lacipirellulaceae bacterium]|nr:DUF5615 family PIN-like protein [Lacipirellulaceae bacterium]